MTLLTYLIWKSTFKDNLELPKTGKLFKIIIKLENFTIIQKAFFNFHFRYLHIEYVYKYICLLSIVIRLSFFNTFLTFVMFTPSYLINVHFFSGNDVLTSGGGGECEAINSEISGNQSVKLYHNLNRRSCRKTHSCHKGVPSSGLDPHLAVLAKCSMLLE